MTTTCSTSCWHDNNLQYFVLTWQQPAVLRADLTTTCSTSCWPDNRSTSSHGCRVINNSSDYSVTPQSLIHVVQLLRLSGLNRRWHVSNCRQLSDTKSLSELHVRVKCDIMTDGDWLFGRRQSSLIWRYYPSIRFERLKKTTQFLTHESWWCGLDSTRLPAKYKFVTLPLLRPIRDINAPYHSFISQSIQPHDTPELCHFVPVWFHCGLL
jgi:hypothetical protein